MYRGRAELMLVLLSDSYSEDDKISISDSRPSSCPVYTVTDYTSSTDYCSKKNVNYFGLRRPFYSKRCLYEQPLFFCIDKP